MHARNSSRDSQANLIVKSVVKWREFRGNKKIATTLICWRVCLLFFFPDFNMAENLSKENKPPISSAYLPSDNLNNSSKSCLLCGKHIAPNNSFFRVSREVLEKLREVLKTTVKHEPSLRLCKSCYRSIDTIHKRKNCRVQLEARQMYHNRTKKIVKPCSDKLITCLYQTFSTCLTLFVHTRRLRNFPSPPSYRNAAFEPRSHGRI